MIGYVEVGQTATIEVSYTDPGLFVGFTIFDDSGATPVQYGSILAGYNFKGGSYRALFTPPDTRPFVIHKAVYTDNTFSTIDPDYGQGSESLRAVIVADVAALAAAVASLDSAVAELDTSVTALESSVSTLETISSSLIAGIVPEAISGTVEDNPICGVVETDEII